MREEPKAKRQLCENAMLYQKEFECNTKEIQTDITFESVATCIEKVDFRVRCCVETFSEQQNVSESEVSETESEP